MVTLRLLGGTNLSGPSGEEILRILSQPKRMAVLSYLAVAGRGGLLRRDSLISLFWAESDTSQARNALNQVLHSLRKDLGSGVVLTRGKHEVGLDAEKVDCDIWSFHDAVQEERYEDALGLYTGSFLPGFQLHGCGKFQRWLEEERDGLREEAARVAWALAHKLVERGALVEAEQTARQALGLGEADETPVREFITALAGAGDRAVALRFYEKFCSVLQRDMDLEPSPLTRRVAEAIRNGAEGGDAGFLPFNERPVVGNTTIDSQTPDRRRSGFWWWVGGTVVVAFLLVYRFGFRSPPVIGPPPVDRPFTILAQVQGSADPEAREAVAFLLQNSLDAAHVVQTVHETEVARALELMEREADTPLDPVLAREVAARLGVSTMVLPRLDRIGDQYILALRVEEVGRGDLRAEARGATEGTKKVVEMVDLVALEIRQKLGETRGVLAATQPLPQVLTHSLEALQKYQLALQNGPGQARDAVSHLREAVAMDTAFAMAWQLMAAYYGNYLNEPDSAESARKRVERFQDRLTAARRSDMELHRRFREDVALWDVALSEAERAVIRNPGFLNNYAVYTAFEAGRPDSALDMRFALEKEWAENARRFDPTGPHSTSCFINTHYWAAGLDRVDEWLFLLDSLQIDLPPDCAREVALFETLAAAEWDDSEAMLQTGAGDWRWPTAVGAASRQLVPLRGGVVRAYGTASPENAEKKVESRNRWSDVSHLLLEVAYPFLFESASNKTFGSAQLPQKLEGRGKGAVTGFVLHGVREALVGDTLEAQNAVRQLQAMRDSATSRTFEGAFEPWFLLMEVGPALRRGDWPLVIDRLEAMAARIHEPGVGFLAGDAYLCWWLLAEAYVRNGQEASAIPHLMSILRRPTTRIQDWTLQGYIHPAARLKLAGLLAGVGNVAEAREHYRIFLDHFNDPDPDVEWMVERARQGLESAGG